jgi:golgi phosphoprotein 3
MMGNEINYNALSFLEKIVLLALNDKGWFGNSESRIKFGLAGAVLFELATRGEIEIRNGGIIIPAEKETGEKVLDAALKVMGKSGKNKELSVTKAILRIVYKSGLKWKSVLKDLIQKEIVRKEEYRLLRIFYQYRYPVVKPDIKKALLDELYSKIMGDQDLSPDDLMLLALMKNCKMIDKNFLLHEHFLKVRLRIKEVTEFKEPLSDETRIISDIQTGIRQTIRLSNVSLHI